MLRRTSQGVDFLLHIRHHASNTVLQIGKNVPNVMDQHVVQGRSQAGRSALGQESTITRVDRMAFEELVFLLEAVTDANVTIDILLTAIDHRNVTTAKRDDLVEKNFRTIRSIVHQIDLCEDSDRTVPRRVDFLCELQG